MNNQTNNSFESRETALQTDRQSHPAQAVQSHGLELSPECMTDELSDDTVVLGYN